MPSEEELMELGRDCAQLLINSLWQLETERIEEAVVAHLPPPTFVLPREKPCPKPKPMTKWEKYAKEKGIDKKKKKDRMVWDDVVQKWVPQFGYKKVQAEQEKNWMIPVKGNAPDDEDPFEKLAESKREKVAKNELQRLRNLAKVKKVNVPSLGVVPSTAKPGTVVRAVSQSEDLRRAAEVAKSSVHTMHAEIDDMLHQAKNSEEKAKKAMVDAARLADELRAEQDHTNGLSMTKRTLEGQLNELEQKFAEANENAMRCGRTAMAKLETRIRELEVELGNVQARSSENVKGYQKSERHCKELSFQIDEDKKNQERMSELATKLQAKIKTYKKQIEEAEEIAALNLAKFRKAQQELEEADERANIAEAKLQVPPPSYF